MKKKTTNPEPTQITPYLYYRDAGAALVWLRKAFGFTPLDVMKDARGKVQHAAMLFENGMLMLGAPGKGFKNPKQLGQATQSLYVRVSNVNKHFARSKKAGAKVLEEPADQFYGDRRYGVVDPEGHEWYFAEAVKGKR
jgi:uncharacterized glyoxalase superfamily protein PhnB